MTSAESLLLPIQGFSSSLGALANFLGAELLSVDVEFSGVTLDSRKVEPGDLFIALPGARHHGASFASEVMARGAVALVTDPVGAAIINLDIPMVIVNNPRAIAGEIAAWFYKSPFRSLDAVGITGDKR
ncbi:MAG: Mur ligase domain-containing protein [Actinomycetota bacterium]